MDSHELNLQLNQSVVQDLSNLEMLRYSYFEAFEYDGNKVDGGDVVTGTPTTKERDRRREREVVLSFQQSLLLQRRLQHKKKKKKIKTKKEKMAKLMVNPYTIKTPMT